MHYKTCQSITLIVKHSWGRKFVGKGVPHEIHEHETPTNNDVSTVESIYLFSDCSYCKKFTRSIFPHFSLQTPHSLSAPLGIPECGLAHGDAIYYRCSLGKLYS